MRASKNLSDIFLRVMAALDSMVKPGAYPQNEVLRLSSRFGSGTSRTRAPGATFHLCVYRVKNLSITTRRRERLPRPFSPGACERGCGGEQKARGARSQGAKTHRRTDPSERSAAARCRATLGDHCDAAVGHRVRRIVEAAIYRPGAVRVHCSIRLPESAGFVRLRLPGVPQDRDLPMRAG